MSQQQVERFIGPDEVFARIGFEDTWVRAQEKAGKFPKSILIGTGKIKRRRWREAEVTEWQQERLKERARQHPELQAA